MPGTPAPGSSSTSGASSRQIGICVASSSLQGTPLPLGSSLPSRATAVSAAPVTSTAFFPVSSAATVGTVPPGTTLQSLGLMVTRFNNPGDSRQPTVILHPRTSNAAMRSVPAAVVVTSSAPGAMRTVPVGQHHQTIPIRLQQQHGHPSGASIQVMNLSVSNPATASSISQATVKQISTPTGRPINLQPGSIPLESTINLLMTNDGGGRGGYRIHGDILSVTKQPGTVSSIHNLAKIRQAGGLAVGQPKVISLSGGNPVTVATNNALQGPQVARLGIISHMSGGAGSNTSKQSPINIVMPKSQAVIHNPGAPGQLVNSSGHHVVASFGGVPTSQGKQTVIPVNQTVVTLTATSQNSRHIITSNSTPSGAGSAGSHVQLAHHHQRQANPSNNQQQAPTNSGLSVQQNAASVNTSPMKSGSVANSPIKQQPQLQQGPTPSSPRPSILTRKRIGNDNPAIQAANVALFKTTNSNATPKPPPVAVLSESSITVKLEEIESNDATAVATALSSQQSLPSSTANSEAGATPRKKPRKQLLEPFTLSTSQNIKLLSSSDDSTRGREDDDLDSDDTSKDFRDERVSYVNNASKKPRPSLIGTCNTPWKSLQYHFLRHSDVKPKPEKKLTLSELSNEGLQKKNGWKIHHLATQMEEMGDNELEVYDRLNKVLETFEPSSNGIETNGTSSHLHDEVHDLLAEPLVPGGQMTMADKLTDLIRGNLQRSNLFQEQITESKQLLIKLTHEHRERVGKLTKKCANKRTFISTK